MTNNGILLKFLYMIMLKLIKDKNDKLLVRRFKMIYKMMPSLDRCCSPMWVELCFRSTQEADLVISRLDKESIFHGALRKTGGGDLFKFLLRVKVYSLRKFKKALPDCGRLERISGKLNLWHETIHRGR